jgi:RNA polymerase sigma-70 factor (ECF subfamily)
LSNDGLETLLAAGQAAWPEVKLDGQRFAAHVRARLSDEQLARAHASDLYLACACLAGDAAALAALEACYISQVGSFISRIDSSKSFVDEVAQILRQRLLLARPGQLPRLAEYSGQGALASWLRVAAVRLAIDLKRGCRAGEVHLEEPAASVLAASSPDPVAELARARYAVQFRQAFAEALGSLDGRARTLLKLHFLDGLNIDKIGQLYSVHRATAARWLADIRASLADEVQSRLERRLRLRAGEFGSLLGVVRSQMNVTLSRILRRGEHEDEG